MSERIQTRCAKCKYNAAYVDVDKLPKLGKAVADFDPTKMLCEKCDTNQQESNPVEPTHSNEFVEVSYKIDLHKIRCHDSNTILKQFDDFLHDLTNGMKPTGSYNIKMERSKTDGTQ